MIKERNRTDMIERYVYAVTHKLPAQQRGDIEQELRSLIEDMLEERVRERDIAPADVEGVLAELGNPRDFAAKYREKRYLIGPEFYDLYMMILKIVALWSFVGITIAFVVQSVLDSTHLLKLFAEYIGSIFTMGVQVIAWVTIVFAVMEYTGVKAANLRNKKNGPWHPSQLSAIPDKRTSIGASGAIAAIIFNILFMVLFLFSSKLLGLHLHVGAASYTFIPFWDQDVFKQLMPLIYGVFGLMILKECVKLYFGKWTEKLVFSMLALDVVIFILYCFFFADLTIWNPNFMNELLSSGVVSVNELASSDSFTEVTKYWDLVKTRVLPIIALVMIIETLVNFYKVYRNRVFSSKI